MYIILSIFIMYSIGIISYEYNFFIYTFVVSFILLLFISFKSKKYICNFVIFLFLILSYFNCNYNNKSLLIQYINQDILFTANVKSMNNSNEESKFNSYNCDILSINNEKLKIKEQTIVYIDKKEKVSLNSIVECQGNVSEANLSKNKILFNYKSYLRSKKIYATIFSSEKFNTTIYKYSFIDDISLKFRAYVENLFRKHLYDKNADIILSIILGNKSYMDDDFYDNIKTMGLAHIFAVSGLHIGLLYGAMIKVFGAFGIYKRTAWIMTWSLLWLYGFLIGFPISVLRTLVMFTVLFGSEVLYRKYNSFNSISTAALVLLLVNPYWLFDVGFELTFSAALAIIIYNKYIKGKIETKNGILEMIYMYSFLQIFTLPIVLYYFNYLPIMGIIYNLFFIPIFNVILIASFIFISTAFFMQYTLILPFKILNFILYSLRALIDLVQNLAFNGIEVKSPPIDEILFFYLYIFFIICMLLYNNKYKKLGFAGFMSIYVLIYIMIPSYDDSLQLDVVDIGQGLFLVLSYDNYNIVMDAGSSSNKNAEEYTVTPYLVKTGRSNVNSLFISHWHLDHYSGIFDMINNNKVQNIFVQSLNNEVELDYSVKPYVLNKGDNIVFNNNLKFNVLWPEKGFESDNINNTSMVILIEYKDKKILFTGDIEDEVEQIILEDLSDVDIVIVPHHGSKTSSTKDFIEKVNPHYAVISYGNNSYGIPSKEVIQRYEIINSKVLTTFFDGEINFVLKDDEIYYNTYTGNKSENFYKLDYVYIIEKIMILIFWYYTFYIVSNINLNNKLD